MFSDKKQAEKVHFIKKLLLLTQKIER